LDAGTRQGIDPGILLFLWNAAGALVTISFLFTAVLFDSDRMDRFPRGLRTIFRGKRPMKLLCHLPGCARFDAEALRRLYVWLMVPLLGMVLLGIESGLQVSTAGYLFESFFSALVALLPHGLVEIPAFARAGAVPYSANLLIQRQGRDPAIRVVFRALDDHRKNLPLQKIALAVVGGLLLAGLIEAHVTPRLM
ncbi:MAG TPA: stage II sporulation protein M, partial [Desulfosarcina sp.]|nr:stage II sporulation protein M [Desulfosarcina sp.]